MSELDQSLLAFDTPGAACLDGPLRFERRREDRWTAHGTATAFCVSGERFGNMHDLRLMDLSQDGLGAISGTVIDPGTNVALGFSNPGYLARRGTVVRCMPCGDGYRVAVRFELRMAA